LSDVGPSPFRLVSITKCFPPIKAEIDLPYAMLFAVYWKFETFSAKPSVAATLARVSRAA